MGWLQLWDTNVPEKAKIHTWRLIQNGLAVGAELQRRKIKQGVRCPICEREETAMHRFWSCPYAQHVWSIVNTVRGDDTFAMPATVHSQQDLKRWLLGWFGSATDSSKGVMITVLYHMWLARKVFHLVSC